MSGNLRLGRLFVFLSLAVLMTTVYAGGIGDISAVLIGDASSAPANPTAGSGTSSGDGGSWARSEDTPWIGVVSITPAPPGYDSGETPNYLPPKKPPVLLEEKEVVIGSILNWRMSYSEGASEVQQSAQEEAEKAPAQSAAPATGFLVGGAALWWVGAAGLLVALAALYWAEKNSHGSQHGATARAVVAHKPASLAARKPVKARFVKKPAKKKRKR